MSSEAPKKKEAFERLKAKLDRVFATPESSYEPLTATEVIARNRTPKDLGRR